MSISDLLYWTAIFGAKKQLGIKHACNIIPATHLPRNQQANIIFYQ